MAAVDDARHFLVIENDDGDYWIAHPPSCPTEEWTRAPGDIPIIGYTCAVGVEVSHAGLDSLDGWRQKPPGWYEIRFWSERHPAIPGLTAEEWSAGLAWNRSRT